MQSRRTTCCACRRADRHRGERPRCRRPPRSRAAADPRPCPTCPFLQAQFKAAGKPPAATVAITRLQAGQSEASAPAPAPAHDAAGDHAMAAAGVAPTLTPEPLTPSPVPDVTPHTLVGNVVERDVSAARARAARGPPASGVGFPKAGHRGQSRVCTGRGGGWEDSLGRGTGLEGEGWGLLQRTPPNPLPTAPARPSLASLRWPAVP